MIVCFARASGFFIYKLRIIGEVGELVQVGLQLEVDG
jgi:hypothetical protein